MRMHPDDAEGIIAVGLTSGDSTGIEAQSGGADGTAPMVLTRQRQCHPGPAGISWRGIGAPAPEQNASFAIPRLQQNFQETGYIGTVRPKGRQSDAANGSKGFRKDR